MGIWGAAIGAGMKAIGSIAGGIIQKKAIGKVEKSLEQQQSQNQDWFDRRYNEDATQRADAQRLLTMTENSIRERNKQAAAAAAVMGGTEESVAAAKAANNQALVDATSNIAASADARKDAIEQQFMAKRDALTGQQNDMIMQKANATQQAVQGVADAAGSIASAF